MKSRFHLLVVDSDVGVREEVSAYLSANGFQVSTAADATAMDTILTSTKIDLVILDDILAGEDGWSICQHLPGANRPRLVIISSLSSDIDRIVGLEMGADDYLTKPFAPRELLARIRAILRSVRAWKSPAYRSSQLRFAGLQLNLVTQELHGPSGQVIALTIRELRLLKAFLDQPNRVLSRDDLIDLALGLDTHIFDRTIDVQLSRLRRKLGVLTDREVIKTWRGEGYMLTADIDQPRTP